MQFSRVSVVQRCKRRLSDGSGALGYEAVSELLVKFHQICQAIGMPTPFPVGDSRSDTLHGKPAYNTFDNISVLRFKVSQPGICG